MSFFLGCVCRPKLKLSISRHVPFFSSIILTLRTQDTHTHPKKKKKKKKKLCAKRTQVVMLISLSKFGIFKKKGCAMDRASNP
jgi:hypothetical protein